MIPSPDPAKIQEALATFDAQMRNTPAWTNWEENQNYAYAIEANGRRYPVKQILAIASGQPVTSFSGGVDGANKVLVDNGFRVVPLHPSGSEDIQPMIRFERRSRKFLADTQKRQASPSLLAIIRSLESSRRHHTRSLRSQASFLETLRLSGPPGEGIGPAFRGLRCSIHGKLTPHRRASTSSTSSEET